MYDGHYWKNYLKLEALLAEEFYGSRKACGTKSLLQAVLYLFLFIFTSYKIFTSSCGKISLLYLNFVENFRHTCAFSRSSSLLWRTLMLPIKADLFFRFWRLEMITLLPWILEIYSQSCEMIYNLQIQPCIEVTSIRDWNLVSVPIFVTVHHHWRTLPYDLSQGAPCCTAGGAGFVQPQPDVCRLQTHLDPPRWCLLQTIQQDLYGVQNQFADQVRLTSTTTRECWQDVLMKSPLLESMTLGPTKII